MISKSCWSCKSYPSHLSSHFFFLVFLRFSLITLANPHTIITGTGSIFLQRSISSLRLNLLEHSLSILSCKLLLPDCMCPEGCFPLTTPIEQVAFQDLVEQSASLGSPFQSDLIHHISNALVSAVILVSAVRVVSAVM